MPFDAITPAVRLGPNIARIADIHLGNGQTGTIGLDGDTGADVQLPAGFPPSAMPPLTLSDVVMIHMWQVDPAASSAHAHFVKSEAPFRITIINDGPAMQVELYIQYLHSLIR